MRGGKFTVGDPSALHPWLARSINLGLVQQTGHTKATRYFLAPDLLRTTGLDAHTTLTRVQPHRLRALILEDLERYPNSASPDIHRRIGKEIPSRTFRRALEDLVTEGKVEAIGIKRWRQYRTGSSNGQKD